MRFPRALSTLPLVALLAACGDDPPKDPEFLAPPETPLELTTEMRGVTFENYNSQFTSPDVVERDLGSAGLVVVRAQISSEHAQTRSSTEREWTPSFAVAEIFDNANVGETLSAATDTLFVVDLQRMDREWLVDWNGLDRDTPDLRESSFSFQIRADSHDSDYQETTIARIQSALDEFPNTPTRLVLGTDMEAYYLQNTADWPYFVQYVRQLQSALAESHPNVNLGVGINWSNFMDSVVPTFLVETGAPAVDFLTVQLAWQTVLDPLYYDAENEVPLLDFYAFASIPDSALYGLDPSTIPDYHYAGIPTMFDEDPPRAAIPVTWFSIGWPVEGDQPSPSAAFFERFSELNNGYNIDRVAWFGYFHFLGSGECDNIRRQEVGASLSRCFRGMYPVPAALGDNPISGAYFGR